MIEIVDETEVFLGVRSSNQRCTTSKFRVYVYQLGVYGDHQPKHATQRSRSFIPFFLLRCLLFLFYLNMINKGTQYDNKRGKIQTCDSEEQACSFLFFFAFFLLRLTDLHGNLPNLKYLRVILLLWECKQEEKKGGK